MLAKENALLARLECSEEVFMESVALTEKYAPSPLPLGWVEIPSRFPGGTNTYLRRGDQMMVLLSASRGFGLGDGDQRVWLHVSLSRRNRLPSYDDMAEVKRLFVGPDRRAIQIFAEESQHININPFVLHLWSVVADGSLGLPGFGAHGVI